MEKKVINKYFDVKGLKHLGILILSIFIGLILLIFCARFFGKKWENPEERNVIIFKNVEKDVVFDSLFKFINIIETYPFPLDKNSPFPLVIDNLLDYGMKKFKLNDKLVGEFIFSDLKKNSQFAKFSDEQINEFIILYKFLFNNGIDFGVYDSDNKYFRFDYKDLTLMYDDPTFDDSFFRFLEYFKDSNTCPADEKLDYYRGIWLTCNGEDTISSSKEYFIQKKFIKK